MANKATFWVVKKVGKDGESMWWQQGSRTMPGWSKKLTPHCLYSSKLAAEKLMAGEGSHYFDVEEGSTAQVAQMNLREVAK